MTAASAFSAIRRGAIDAVRQARQRCWRYDWVLDIDVKGYFDSIDWELLLKAVRHHTNCAWARLYIERWLKAPVQMEDGSVARERPGGSSPSSAWGWGAQWCPLGFPNRDLGSRCGG